MKFLNGKNYFEQKLDGSFRSFGMGTTVGCWFSCGEEETLRLQEAIRNKDFIKVSRVPKTLAEERQLFKKLKLI